RSSAETRPRSTGSALDCLPAPGCILSAAPSSNERGCNLRVTVGNSWTGYRLTCPKHHAEQIPRRARIREQIELFERSGAQRFLMNVSKCRKVLDGKADGIEERDLMPAGSPFGTSCDYLPKLGHGMIGGNLL